MPSPPRNAVVEARVEAGGRYWSWKIRQTLFFVALLALAIAFKELTG